MGASCRPELTEEQAARFDYHEVLRYVGTAGSEKQDPWDPVTDIHQLFGVQSAPIADYRVDPAIGVETTTQFRSVQAAVNQACKDAKRTGRTAPIVIELAPGRYAGLVYVPALCVDGLPVRIMIVGTGPDPAHTVIHANIDAEMSGDEFAATLAQGVAHLEPEIRRIYQDIAERETISTANASVLRVENDGFVARNLTVQNTYNADRLPRDSSDIAGASRADFQLSTGQHQAVALMVAGADQAHFENVHLKSHQDTLYLKSPAPFSTARSYFRGCTIEGDVDFIFGQATAYFSQCRIVSIGARALHSWVTAPSTNLRSPYGFVFDDCLFTHDQSANARQGVFSLGRQWFEGVRATPYGRSPLEGYLCELGDTSAFDPPRGTISRATLEAVGKCVVLRSRIGAHINPSAPWDDWNGGTFNRAGDYVPGMWSPRFRPVQYTAGDFLENLKGVLPLDPYRDIDPRDVFLGEFQNAGLPD